MNRNLVFIRHSQAQPEVGVPAKQWRLTAEGRRRCGPLSEQLTPYDLDRILTSKELKAIETGKLAAQKLGIPCQTAENLHEHERDTAPYFDTKAEFLETVNELLSKPEELIFGEETGQEARERFAGAVKSVMNAFPRDNIAIVTHGTVLSLFVSQFTGKEIHTFWQGLGMPAIVVLSYPEMILLAQVNEID